MRYLILSDIHANWDALQAVLNDASGSYDQIINCGDLVGYGPDPNRVVDWCRENNTAVIRGNHDKACATMQNLDWFNAIARAAAAWTYHTLTPENREYLQRLAQGPVAVESFTILHGAPQDEDEYIVTEMEANDAAPHLNTPISFFGHTHLQGGFMIHRNGVRRIVDADLEVADGSLLYLVNPGSVGQPRDGDPRAAYALYDTAEKVIAFHRTEYDIDSVYRKIVGASLPEPLGRRLYAGF